MKNLTRFALEFFNECLFKILIRIDKKSAYGTNEKSDSENTSYVDAVQKIVSNDIKFLKFRRNLRYKAILEHVSYKLGKKYLLKTLENGYEVKDVIELVDLNDQVGRPQQFHYQVIGLASPTTLRYIKVAGDLEALFDNPLRRVAEIGVGYGGQASVLLHRLEIESYYMFDLNPVLELADKFLSITSGSKAVKKSALNSVDELEYDLVISNYAFSELPKALQELYCKNLLSKSSHGYMTMNSGRTNFTGRSIGKMSLPEIQEYLPTSRIYSEDPISGEDNYILVWGDHNTKHLREK